MTTRALNSSGLVVKSASVPAKTKPPSYEAFDDFIASGEGIRRTVESMRESERILERALRAIEDGHADFERYEDDISSNGPLAPGDLAGLIHHIRAFRESLDYYTRDEVADRKERGRVRRAVINQQVALLIGSVPSAQPHNPKVYAAMMVEEINAARVGPVSLEMACRQIRREGKSFAPSIPEMLKALKAAFERIQSIVWAANTDAEKLSANLAKLHRKAKRALKIARAKRIEREERLKART
jgi:hypothetical protein